MRSDDVDLSIRGPIMAAVYEILLGGAMQQRIAGAVPAEQITDVHFRTLMADPVATIEQAYAALGVPFHDSMRSSIPAYLESKPKGKFGIHPDPLASASTSRACERSSPTTSNTTASNWTHERSSRRSGRL